MMFLKKLKKLKARKAKQITDVPVKILKKNADILSAYICDFLNQTIKNGNFHVILIMAISQLFSIKVLRDLRKTIGQ